MGASIVIRLCLPNYLTAAVRATLMDFLQKLVKKIWEINEPKVGWSSAVCQAISKLQPFFGDQIAFDFLA